jgi:hypothetical protein
LELKVLIARTMDFPFNSFVGDWFFGGWGVEYKKRRKKNR